MDSKNSFTLQNLERLIIRGCRKLEVIFPASVVECLPELKYLEITECQELKQIIQEEENKESSNNDNITIDSPQPYCFPKLNAVYIENCNNLRRLFFTSSSSSACRTDYLPSPEIFIIDGASEASELGAKLKVLLLMNHRQGIELSALMRQLRDSCPKLSLTSVVFTLEDLEGKLSNLGMADFERSGLYPLQILAKVAINFKSDKVFTTTPKVAAVESPHESIKDKIKESGHGASTSEDTRKAATSAGIEGNGLGGVHPESSSHLKIVAKLKAFKQYVDMDDEHIDLLDEAILVYPHLWEVLAKSRVRFQVWMLESLADMLFFLRKESAASVSPQRLEEFQKLCDEAVQLGFDKPWVDEMRKRVKIRDHGVDSVDSKEKCFDFL